ncbi:MAG: hypothetical protein Tsb0010_04100 [Parvularculaceae bacterium]
MAKSQTRDTTQDQPQDETAAMALEMLKTCLAGRVRQINRSMSSRYDEALRPSGMTANQLTLLCIIATLGPSRSAELQPYLGMEQSTLSRNLDRMIKKGWLKKLRDDDGRAHRLALTPKGRKALKEARPRWQEAQNWAEELFGGAGARQVDKISKTLNPRIP